MKKSECNEFEYDEQKSNTNKHKHGIDFLEAQQLWDDIRIVEIPTFVNLEEERYIVTGRIEAKHWSAVITYRGKTIRIISVRRARDKEVAIYESG